MNKELHKNDIAKKISDKLIDEKIVVGGNKYVYKRKYHLKYTQKIITNVIDAFWEVVADTIAEGDSIKLYNYIKIEPVYLKERVIKSNGVIGSNEENIVPAQYRIRFAIGEYLKGACRKLLEKNTE